MARKLRARSLEYTRVAFPLTKGVEQSVDRIHVPPPSLKRLKNMFLGKTGSAEKRNGYDNITTSCVDASTLPAPLANGVHNDHLLSFSSQGRCAEYLNDTGQWVTGRGTAYSLRIQSEPITGSETSAISSGLAIVNNFRIAVYIHATQVGATVSEEVRVSVFEQSSGSCIIKDQVIYSDTGGALGLFTIKLVTFGSSVYVFFGTTAGSAIRCLILNTASLAALRTSLAVTPTAIVNDLAASGFDADLNSQVGVFLAYISTAGASKTIKYGFVSSTPAFVNSSSYVAANTPITLSCAVGANFGMHGVAFIDNAAIPNNVYALHRSYNAGTHVWTNTSTSGALETGLVGSLANVACRYEPSSSTQLNVWASGDDNGSTFGLRAKIHKYSYTTAGVPAVVSAKQGAFLVSKPFTYDSIQYYWAFSGAVFGNDQPTMMLVRDSDHATVAKALDNIAYPGEFLSSTVSLCVVDGSDIYCSMSFLRKIVTLGSFIGAGTTLGVKHVIASFDHPEGYAFAEQGGELYMAGDGFMKLYDGRTWVESDFLTYMSEDSVDWSFTASLGTFVANNSYTYYLIQERTTANGNVQRGTAIGITVLQGATTYEVQFVINSRAHTLMDDMVIAVYRTGPNPTSDDPAYRIGQVANSTTASTVTFKDLGNTTSLEGLYMIDEIENIAPPACHIMASGNGRLWLAGSDAEPDTVFFSKLRQDGTTISFSDTNKIVCPSDGGPITALAVLGRVLLVFKRTRIYVISGDGPSNDRNSNGVFNNPELLSFDVGCSTSRSMVQIPDGIIFFDGNKLQIVTTSYQVAWMGDKIMDAFADGQTVVASVLDPIKQHARFALDDGNIVVFDYYNKQWCTMEYA